MTLLGLLEYLTDALFVGLAGICYVQWRRQGGAPAAWLALTFGTLAAVVLLGLALGANQDGGQPGVWVTRLLVAVLLLFPYLLFRFTASLDRAARRTEALVGASAGAVLLWTLLLPRLPAEGEPRPRWLFAYLLALLLEWTVASTVAAVKLWRAGRGQPPAARKRMRGLSLGATGLSVVLVVSGLGPASPSRSLQVVTGLLTVGSALLFYLAFAPPAMVRDAWRRSEQELLRRAMGDLKSAGGAGDVADRILPHVVSMVGGRGAALVDPSGRLIGSVGELPDGPVEALADGQVPGLVRLPLSAGGFGGLESEAGSQVAGGHAERSGSPPENRGALVVWASPYAPLFGRQEHEVLRALGSLAELALERVRAAERDAELAAVLEASGDAIVSTDPAGVVRSWNRAAEETYGRTAGEAVGRPLAMVVPHDRADDLHELLRHVGQGERVLLETQHLRADGTAFSVALTAAPLRSQAGAVAGVSLVARDVTDRKRAQHALEQAKEAADRANEAKSEYLSRMSHELRTPLNAILGFAQLLEMDGLQGEQRESLGQILSAARHLLDLINEVLDIAAIEAGRLPLSVEPVGLAEVVGEAVELMRPLADQHGVLLEGSATAACDDFVLADRQRLKQILLNLLSNGIKYNHEGGSVRVACEPGADGRFRIEVADSGPGIPDQALDQLFVPFERLAASFTGVEGTGLGLPLSQRLANAMGGSLGVATIVGQGSTFWVELPVAERPSQRGEPRHQDATERQAARPARNLTVLYIEDNASNLELVERIVQRRGASLISAMRPVLGLELAREHGPDLVLLDLQLPDIPGEEVLRRLQADPRTAGIPVVILSADARPGLVTMLLAAGARAFLTKPIDVGELLGMLDQVADERTRSGASASGA
ncbi:MAG TPA: ATP-binding protein [Actinomycetes bacterium]